MSKLSASTRLRQALMTIRPTYPLVSQGSTISTRGTVNKSSQRGQQDDGVVRVGMPASRLRLGAPEQPLRAHEQYHHQHQKCPPPGCGEPVIERLSAAEHTSLSTRCPTAASTSPGIPGKRGEQEQWRVSMSTHPKTALRLIVFVSE